MRTHIESVISIAKKQGASSFICNALCERSAHIQNIIIIKYIRISVVYTNIPSVSIQHMVRQNQIASKDAMVSSYVSHEKFTKFVPTCPNYIRLYIYI